MPFCKCRMGAGGRERERIFAKISFNPNLSNIAHFRPPFVSCVDIIILQRQHLMKFNGDIARCLVLLRQHRNGIYTTDLMERFKYYKGKGLIPDINAKIFDTEKDAAIDLLDHASDVPRNVKLPLLFNFKDEHYKHEDFSKNRNKSKYNREIVKAIDEMIQGIEMTAGATKVQSLFRGKSNRRMVEDRKVSSASQLRARMLLQRLMRGAIARRRVKKAKEARRRTLMAEGKEDDTKNKTYSVVFKGEEGLGFTVRGCSSENLDIATQLNLLSSLKGYEKAMSNKEPLKLPEVSSVKENSYAESETIAPGDLILGINGKICELKKLKKKVHGAREGGKAVNFLFMRGARVRVGNTSSL